MTALPVLPAELTRSLAGLGHLDGDGRSTQHVYGGTVPWPVVRDRRRRNQLARVARRATRKAATR